MNDAQQNTQIKINTERLNKLEDISRSLIATQENVREFKENDLPTILNGQRVILKCMAALKHGDDDAECDWELWHERRTRFQPKHYPTEEQRHAKAMGPP